MLYEMLAGRPPFADGNYNMIIAQLLTARPPRLDDLRKKLPKPVVVAVHRALEKEPAARFATADAFIAALPGERAGSQPELVDTLPTERGAPIGMAKRRWIAGALVVLAGGAFAAMLVLHDRPAAPQPLVASPEPSRPPPPVIKPGTLEIKTIPPNAAIRIDNREAGATPIEVVVAPGRHRLHVELVGFTGVDADQDVRDGERTSATFTLVPLPPTPAPAIVKPVVKPVVKPAVKPHPPAAAGSAAPPVTTPVTTPVNPYDTTPVDPPPPIRRRPIRSRSRTRMVVSYVRLQRADHAAELLAHALDRASLSASANGRARRNDRTSGRDDVLEARR